VLTLDDTTNLTIGGDLLVHRLGFGAMRLTGPPAWLDRSTSIAIARRAVELGVTFIDTADSTISVTTRSCSLRRCTRIDRTW
jgi:predicted aldo/keto reductase-like oxidoreductase